MPSPVLNPDSRSPCPIAGALDILGDRWTLVVLRDLFRGFSRYNQFLESPEHISTSTLANRLQRSKSTGLVSTTTDPMHGKREIFALTSRGRELEPVLNELAAWGKRHLSNTFPVKVPIHWDRFPGTQTSKT